MLDFLESLPELMEPPVLSPDLRAPFPWFGGKRKAAAMIWERLGDVAWKATGGYGNQRKDGTNDNARRERLWFSPHCLKRPAAQQLSLIA